MMSKRNTKAQNLTGTLSTESILIRAESNWIQMLSLRMTGGVESSSGTVGDNHVARGSDAAQAVLSSRCHATGSISVVGRP